MTKIIDMLKKAFMLDKHDHTNTNYIALINGQFLIMVTIFMTS